MKLLKASHINDLPLNDIDQLHSILNEQEKHSLEFHLWRMENEYKPTVNFSVAHNNHSVLLKFFVEEKEVRAMVTQTNGAVWEDSCVEFFISFDDSGYYNFEFNCIGTVLAAFRKNRDERMYLPEEMLKKVETYTKLNRKNDFYKWEILIVIPIEMFIAHSLQSLSGIVCKANFYKCGDRLLQPHYLSWNHIESETPNFHLPQFFGELSFA